MKTAAVICHGRFFDLAAFDDTLHASDYQVRYLDAGHGAQRLASTPACENQAFSLGKALAVQCHPEVAARHFERWLICNAGQIALLENHTVASLRDQAARYADIAAARGREWFAGWLAQVCAEGPGRS